MNYRWKIAILAMLGLSTAACCGTKKAAKGQDKAENNIEVEGIDNRVMLMYGVPMPDGSFPKPVVDENPQPVRPGMTFPDGRSAVVMTEERAAELMKLIEKESEGVEVVKEIDGVPFPDGSVAVVMTKERAEELMKLIEAELEARQESKK